MPEDSAATETKPFVFVSHADADKGSGRFREVIKILLAHEVPLGLDRPHKIDDPDINPDAFLWSLGPDGKADKSQKGDSGVNKDNVLSWQ